MSSSRSRAGLRSPYDKVGGLFYFGRMLDKIRGHSKGELPPQYEAKLGKGLDEKCLTFLRVRYALVVDYVNENMTDGAILQSCFAMGNRPSEDEVYMWNEFMRNFPRSWSVRRKKQPCFPGRRSRPRFNLLMPMRGAT
jgi:hypothetical protein